MMKGTSSASPEDFLPPLLRIQRRPPAPLAGWMLRLLVGLVGGIVVWAVFGRLDIVAVAQGKLVPSSYLKIVQPAEQGIIEEILVREGQSVKEGQVLIRMDSAFSGADLKAVESDYRNKRLALRRVNAQLAGTPLIPDRDDSADLYSQVQAQYAANVGAYRNALAQEETLLEKARHDRAAAVATKAKLEQILPHYIDQEAAFAKLLQDGFAGRMMYTDKKRERIEKEQDLRSQESVIKSSESLIEQSERKIAQLTADYRRQLQAERIELAAQLERIRQELAKHDHRHRLLELRAPQAGVVKDLATHTAGTVVAPGTILMTIVPEGDRLIAEIWVSNHDVGFVREGQATRLKVAAFQFQKYGLVEGKVLQINPDASEGSPAASRSDGILGRDRLNGALAFRTLVELSGQDLSVDGRRYALHSGMQVAGEIHLGTRTVLEYVLSPVQKAFHEAGRER